MEQTLTQQATRELTTLEYVILGFMAIAPQSGYAIINQLQMGVYRVSASTGSIYPVLKRLEQAELIQSVIESTHELRPRKVYTLLPSGAQLLDSWLRHPPMLQEVIEDYDIAMHKFLIAEYRLPRTDVLIWLDQYESIVKTALTVRAALDQATQDEPPMPLHAQLVNQSTIIEIEARLNWIHIAQARLRAE